MPRKRRTRQHVIADLSVNFVERQALLSGFSVERIEHDYGIDLILFTYDTNGEVDSGQVYIQITVHLSKQNKVDASAMRRFSRYRDEVVQQTQEVIRYYA